MSASPKYVGPGEAVKLFFSNFLNFRGRSTRSEFWWLVVVGLLLSGVMIGGGYLMKVEYATVSKIMSVISILLIIPNITLTARRLHDSGHGFGWIFINILPIIGSIWFLVLLAKPSGPQNRWGYPAGQRGMTGGMPGMGMGMNGQMMGQPGRPMPGQPMQPMGMQPGMTGMQPGMQGGMSQMSRMNQMGQTFGNMAQGAMNMVGQAFSGQPGQSPISSLGGAAASLGAAAMGAMQTLGQGQNPFAALQGGMGMQGGMQQGMPRVCPNCGVQSNGVDRFCQNCGAQLQ